MLKFVLTLILMGISAPVLAQGAGKATTPAVSAPLAPGQQIKSDPVAAPALQQTSMEDIKRLPIVRNLTQGGGELYFLGERSGLLGFLLYRNEQMQTLYLSGDLQTVIFGAMYSGDSANVTAQQIHDVSNQNPQLAGILAAAVEKQHEFEKTSGLSNEESGLTNKSGLPAAASLSPGERLHHDFTMASGVIVGQPGKPLLLMLVDPLCVHCQATWRLLKQHVETGNLRVKLIPVGPEGSERERMAAKFLHVPEPLKVWNKVEDGDLVPLDGTPPPADLAAVRSTMAMVKNWKITATPYLVYRGKDGKIKVVQGEPEKIGAVLTDITP